MLDIFIVLLIKKKKSLQALQMSRDEWLLFYWNFYIYYLSSLMASTAYPDFYKQ